MAKIHYYGSVKQELYTVSSQRFVLFKKSICYPSSECSCTNKHSKYETFKEYTNGCHRRKKCLFRPVEYIQYWKLANVCERLEEVVDLKHFRLLCRERGRPSLVLARQHSAPHTPSLGPVSQLPQGLPIPGTPEAMLHPAPGAPKPAPDWLPDQKSPEGRAQESQTVPKPEHKAHILSDPTSLGLWSAETLLEREVVAIFVSVLPFALFFA